MKTNAASSHLTVRGVPRDVATALNRERRRRGTSLNQTVIDVLRQGLGVRTRRTNGLAALAGTWSRQEHERFQRAIAMTEEIDEDLWR